MFHQPQNEPEATLEAQDFIAQCKSYAPPILQVLVITVIAIALITLLPLLFDGVARVVKSYKHLKSVLRE